MFIMSLVPLMNSVALVLGGIINKFFKYQEKYTLVLFSIVAVFSIILLRLSMGVNLTVMSFAFGGLLASLFVVNNMLTIYIPLNFKKDQKVSSAVGIMDCSVYIGAAIAGPLVGLLIDRFGWTGIVNGWTGGCVLVVVMGMLSKNYKKP
ncbi:hypothetical protein AGMMS49579_24000 [Spirochaetia bacterium]|nr:hypothetical protein AGMMS49579_24000 [Spirochaetia bacterium]